MHSVETILTVLTARLLHKGTILQQRTVVLLQKKKDFRCLEVLEGFLNCSTKNLNKKPSSEAFFMALDPTEYWEMISEWVIAVFTNRKITVK